VLVPKEKVGVVLAAATSYGSVEREGVERSCSDGDIVVTARL
jgi:hypothetical protein